MRNTIAVSISALALLVPVASSSAADGRLTDLVSVGTSNPSGFGTDAANGSHVILTVQESLVSDDTDVSLDVYDLAGGTPTLLSDRVQPGDDEQAISSQFAGASADGSRVFFTSGEQLVSADTDAQTDIYERSGGLTSLLSDRVQAGADENSSVIFLGVSDDGSRVLWRTEEPIVSADTDTASDVYESAPASTTLMSDRVQAGPDGDDDVFTASISDDGSRVTFETEEPILSTDGDDSTDVYQRVGGTTSLLSKRVRSGSDEEVDATFQGASADGSHVFFRTAEPIAIADDDTSSDIYERTGTATTIRSDRIQAGADEQKSVSFGGVSADGAHVFFQTSEKILSTDGDSSTDLYERAGGTTTLVSVRAQAGADEEKSTVFAGASADGSRVFFLTDEALAAADGDVAQDIYERSGGTTTLLSDRQQGGVDGSSFASFVGSSADGSRVFFTIQEPIVEADGDLSFDIYERAGGTTTLLSDRVQAGADADINAGFAGASDDGSRVYMFTDEPLVDSDLDITDDIYVSRPAPPPPDGDGDGVPDSSDACLRVAASTADGCPAVEGPAGPGSEPTPSPGPGPTPDPTPTPKPTGPTDGDDVLNGTKRADRICGLGGSDVINGLAGNDVLIGDACSKRRGPKDGNDKLNGGAGNDTLFGGAGVNRYDGGAGNDTINARNGKRETVNCGAGKRDKATVDKRDKVKGCEKVKRARK